MDFSCTTEFLGNKTILITGATGFIAKILLEKILRIQPNVKQLYLLLRATGATEARTRLQDEVLGKELFKVLKEKLGAKFKCLVSAKLTPIAGDTSYENLGLTGDILYDMYKTIDVIINVAATTKFDERYDVALGANTFGAKHVVEFAKNCTNIELLIHVSTAYVCGEIEGVISENPFAMGETLNGRIGLDIEHEKKIVEQTLRSLKAKEVPEKEIRQIMKTLGSQRAKYYGWPNAYVFTKAMGEMIVGKLRGNLPVVIMRPTIVCSTLKEPFPGWIEGCKTIDSFIVGYGKGALHVFCADSSSVLDLIPADMFVNTIIVAMKAHANQPNLAIFQVGSSYRNPISFDDVHEILHCYFTKNPWSNRDGKLIKPRKSVILSNIQIFKTVLYIWYLFLQMILLLTSGMGSSNLQHKLFNLDKKLNIAMKLLDVYKPYIFFKGIFADKNTEMLRRIARENGLDEEMFNIDPLFINWNEFFFNVHIPSIVKYQF